MNSSVVLLFALDLHQKIRDRRLHRHVERRHRLVRHDNPWRHRQRRGRCRRAASARPRAAAACGRQRRGAVSPDPAAPASGLCGPRRILPKRKISSARMIWRPTVIEGLSVSNGFWKTICTELTRSWCCVPQSVWPRWIGCRAGFEPSVAVSSPISTLARVDLPQPDSPTMARVSAFAGLKTEGFIGLDDLRASPPPNMALAATS